MEGSSQTKIMLLVLSERPGIRTNGLVRELLYTIPNVSYYRRKGFALHRIVMYAISRNFTSIMVIQEDQRLQSPDSLCVISLPFGPMSCYKISNLLLGSDNGVVPRQCGKSKVGAKTQRLKGSLMNANCNSEHVPEVICTRFQTRLGTRVNRQFKSLFPCLGEEFDQVGRRVVAFHNQRDFIFFRHYRYVFKNVSEVGDTADNAAAATGKSGSKKKRRKAAADDDDYAEFALLEQQLQEWLNTNKGGSNADGEEIDDDGEPAHCNLTETNETGSTPPPSCALQEIGPRFTLRLRYVKAMSSETKRRIEHEMQQPQPRSDQASSASANSSSTNSGSRMSLFDEFEYMWRPDANVNRALCQL